MADIEQPEWLGVRPSVSDARQRAAGRFGVSGSVSAVDGIDFKLAEV